MAIINPKAHSKSGFLLQPFTKNINQGNNAHPKSQIPNPKAHPRSDQILI